MKLAEQPDTWPLVMAQVAAELLKRGILHPSASAQQVIQAAENVTGITPDATDSLADVAARWQDWFAGNPVKAPPAPIALPKPPTP